MLLGLSGLLLLLLLLLLVQGGVPLGLVAIYASIYATVRYYVILGP